MHITNSDVTSQSVQQRTNERLQQRQESVLALSREEAQRKFDNRSVDQEASVTLELTTTHTDRLALQSAAKVTGPDGSTRNHFGQSIAETITENTLQGTFTIRRAGPSNGADESTDASYLDITTIEKVQTQTSIQMNTQGSVTTADGREINFLLQLEFDRVTEREQMNRFVGDVDLIDPLTINLEGKTVQLSDEVFNFDLNADGKSERISKTATGSGYLVFDRNGNGQIDDGSELFGPSTGHGYQELAELDDDGNGWIDEGDKAFAQLGFWQFDAAGASSIQSLSDVGLGALSLTRSATDYDLLNDDGELLAQVKNSGAALMENGAVAVMQELNLRNFVTERQQGFIDDDGMARTPVNPLGFFQGSNAESIQNRNADTRVQIQRKDGLATARNDPAITRAAVDQEVTHSAATMGGIQVSSADTLERSTHALNSHRQQQALERMQSKLDLSTRLKVSTSDQYVWTPDAAEHRFLNNLPTQWQFDQTPEEGLLEKLKSLVQALKDIQQQQKESLKKLGLYQQISGLAAS